MDINQNYQTVRDVCGGVLVVALIIVGLGMRGSKRMSITTPPPKPPRKPSDD